MHSASTPLVFAEMSDGVNKAKCDDFDHFIAMNYDTIATYRITKANPK